MLQSDQKFMHEAILEAKRAFVQGEVPIGAVLVHEEKIIARACNKIEQTNNAACHAEILCLQEASKKLNNWRLLECTLYCTLEPCAMCAGAMILFRIKRLVYGASDLRHGANGSIFDVLNRPHPIHQIEILGGVFANEAKELMQDFFKERRKLRL